MEMNQPAPVGQEPSGMHRWILWVVIIVVIAAVGYGAYQYRNSSSPAKTAIDVEPQPAPQPAPRNMPSHATVEVAIRDTGFDPATVVIEQGDTVKFMNKRSVPAWPASGVHPTHLLCPGFDALRGLKTGETYSFTFNEVKECPMHDHLAPAIKGKIIVKEPSAMKGGQ